MGQPVVHFEFWSKDPARISDFYTKVFGWGIRSLPEMDYFLVEKTGHEGIGGGIMRPKEGPWPGNMTFYIDVDDLGAFRRKVVEGGGKIIVEQQDVADVGAFCLFSDPDGRVLGLWKQIKR